ncbi:hypothetical protein COD94_30895 [Bacillus cereus]|nr:hypothetical protein COD94_30895 [Bacillus cereus]
MGVQYILLKLKWFKSEEGTLGCLFLYGVPPHRYQLKKSKHPQNKKTKDNKMSHMIHLVSAINISKADNIILSNKPIKPRVTNK